MNYKAAGLAEAESESSWGLQMCDLPVEKQGKDISA